MGKYEKIKRFIEVKIDKWYVVFMSFLILEILNYGFLSMLIPWWVCNIISIFIICFLVFYIVILYCYLRRKIKAYVLLREKTLNEQFAFIEQHMNNLCEENIRLKNEIFEKTVAKFTEDIKNSAESITKLVVDTEINNHIYLEKNFMQQENISKENYKEIKDDLRRSTISVNEKLDDKTKLANELAKSIKEVINESSESATSSMENITGNLENLNIALENKIEELNICTNENREQIIESVSKLSEQEENINRIYTEEFKNMTNALGTAITTSELGRLDSEKRLSEIMELNKVSSERIISENYESTTTEIRELRTEVENSSKHCNDELILATEKIENGIESKNEVLLDKLDVVSGAQTTLIKESEVSLIKKNEEIYQDIIDSIQKNYEKGRNEIVKQSGVVENKITELDKKTDALSIVTEKMQSELTNLMVQLLDNLDEDSEKARKSYDGIFKQITSFSIDTKQNLLSLTHDIQEYENSLEEHREKERINYEDREEKIQHIENQMDIFISDSLLSQKEVKFKLENLQMQILNLNSLAGVIKNISETQIIMSHEQAKARKQGEYVDEIYDSETGVKVLNHYSNKKIILSEMYNGEKKNYAVEYDGTGKIIKSTNFDNNGNVLTELQYFSNGQVSERTENVVIQGIKKSIVSKFDQQGNKIN